MRQGAEGRRHGATQAALVADHPPAVVDGLGAEPGRLTSTPSRAAFADAAADAMREAQAAAVEGRGADVGGALRALRDRTAELVKRANTAAHVGPDGRPTSRT